MFEFGRELKRLLGSVPAEGHADTSLLELLDAEQLAQQAKAWDIAAGRVSTRDPFPRWLDSAQAWRERARRSGDPVALRKAAAAAASARKSARNEIERARAGLEQALAGLTGADLFGDSELLDSARDLLRDVADTDGDALFEARLETAWARLASREALSRDDFDRAMEAAALFDSAVHKLERLSRDRASAPIRLEAVAARIERSDLLAGFGVRRRESRLLRSAAEGLEPLLTQIDHDFEPVTWSRSAEVLGSALVALGELECRPETVAEGASVLAAIGDRLTREHSPLDWAKVKHALGVALQALGEAMDNEEAFVEADLAFGQALSVLSPLPLVMRSTAANNRAACLARAAERRGDLPALSRAETAFKVELSHTNAAADPISWAVLQVNIARVHEARADLMGEFVGREAAVYALEEAFEVFCDHGLKTLADQASSGLERIRAFAG